MQCGIYCVLPFFFVVPCVSFYVMFSVLDALITALIRTLLALAWCLTRHDDRLHTDPACDKPRCSWRGPSLRFPDSGYTEVEQVNWSEPLDIS